MVTGVGIFSWEGLERRSGRYGFVALWSSNYFETDHCKVELDVKAVIALEGKRVKMTAEVVETRKSGHIGDRFYKIQPETPEVGEVIELGVGTLQLKWFNDVLTMALEPSDGRDELWFDPRKLYRLHDQTVKLALEETEEPEHEAPVLELAESDGTISNGDGTFQVKGAELPKKIPAKVKRLGDGMFVMSYDYKDGERVS